MIFRNIYIYLFIDGLLLQFRIEYFINNYSSEYYLKNIYFQTI